MAYSAGTKLGPYEIVAPIGAGGMGEVYRAHDSRLQRDVAIKVSGQQFSDRFEREARAIAALNHSNICQVYDIGPNYLVMELVDGAPLAGPLPLDVALRHAVQIADALSAAHAKGITHRDLKPANILVTSSGIKLLDFGLALLTRNGGDCERAADLTAAIGMTEAGTILGTAAYMSPEQAEAKPADARSDIFSFGVVFYEMLSGRRAFSGDTAIATMAAIVRDEPKPLDVPAEVARVVARCLRKSPAERFQTASELRVALAASTLSKPEETSSSIAVLPFANLSADRENEYFSDGLAEEILNALSQVAGLNVAARTSSFSFKGKAIEIGEIAARLNVSNVLQGSVRRAANRVRVTVQLVDARNGFQIWSERYDRQMEDIFEVQDEIASAIAERLKVTLSSVVKPSTRNLEAYELYLKGRYYWHQRTPAAVRLAIQCFEQTIQLDAQYALAYAGLADCYAILRVYGWVSAEDGRPPAQAAMTRAMALAPELSEVNFSRAFFAFYFEREWREAGPHFRNAIAINPRSSIAEAYYGLFLATDGREEEALAHSTRACQMDPLSAPIHGFSTVTFFSLGRFDLSERAARQALELQPDYTLGLWVRGLALSGLGRHEEAIESLERTVTLSRAPVFLGALGLVYARAGRLEDAIRLLREMEDRGGRGEYIPAFAPLAICVGQGDVPAIRRMLSQALAETTPPFSLRASAGPFLDAFRSDPEIDRLLFGFYGR